MAMLKAFLIAATSVACLATTAAEETKTVSLDQCPVDWKSEQKKLGPCNQLDVAFRNGCDVAIDVKICLETPSRKDGWFCGASMNIQPNAGWHWAVCEGTGEKKVWVKKAGDYKHSFPKFP